MLSDTETSDTTPGRSYLRPAVGAALFAATVAAMALLYSPWSSSSQSVRVSGPALPTTAHYGFAVTGETDLSVAGEGLDASQAAGEEVNLDAVGR